MNMPVMDGHDGDDSKPHPENKYRCRPCENAHHDSCRGNSPAGIVCNCDCRDAMRTKKHDWLDERFDDEIELEKSMGDAPPRQLVVQASMRGAVTPTALDAAWFFLGKFKTSSARPSTTDARWELTCKRCEARGEKTSSKIKTTRIVVEEQPQQELNWLHERKAHTERIPEHAYRVGRCRRCQSIFWFEMLVKK